MIKLSDELNQGHVSGVGNVIESGAIFTESGRNVLKLGNDGEEYVNVLLKEVLATFEMGNLQTFKDN